MSTESDEVADVVADFTGIENLEGEYNDDETVTNIRIDLDMQMDIDADREQYQIFDENGSIASFGRFLSPDPDDESLEVDEEKDSPAGTLSTLTDNESAEAIAKRLNEDPEFRNEVLNKTIATIDMTSTTTPSPTKQIG